MLDLIRIGAVLNQLSAEKKIPRDRLDDIVKSAIQTAYRKKSGQKDANLTIEIDYLKGTYEASIEKVVMKEVTNPSTEIGFDELGDDAGDFEEGDIIELDVTDEVFSEEGFGRIASQAARQVIIQKIQDTEKEKLYELFKDKKGSLVNMKVELVEYNRLVLDYNSHQIVIPKSEQISRDRYTPGQRLYYLVKEVEEDTPTGPRVLLSRRDAVFVEALFRMNVPEIEEGTVEILSIARMTGFKTKIVVGTEYEGVDPAGSLIGPKGMRVRAVVDELFGEKIDIITYNGDKEKLIRDSLIPGETERVEIDEEKQQATVWVRESEKAKVLGKGGANINLASDLVGYRLTVETAEEVETLSLLSLDGSDEEEDMGGPLSL